MLVNYAFSARDEWLTRERNGNKTIKKHFAYARVKPDTRERHTRTVRLKASTLPRVAVFFFFFFSYDALHVICMTRCNTFFFSSSTNSWSACVTVNPWISHVVALLLTVVRLKWSSAYMLPCNTVPLNDVQLDCMHARMQEKLISGVATISRLEMSIFGIIARPISCSMTVTEEPLRQK